VSRPPGAAVGGQAVIEGVMMRAPEAWAVAVRRPDGVIEAKRNELPPYSDRSWFGRTPFLRGISVLIEALSLGFSALSWSAQKAGDEDEQISRAQVWGTMAIAIVLAVVLFIMAPAFGADFLKRFVGDSTLAFVILDGAIRLALIVGYIWLIGRSAEVQRVFQYHGAEHKTIHAYENGDPLEIGPIQQYSPRHPRCGTSFIIIVAMVAFVVFLFLAPLPFIWQILGRIILIPFIAGISYEVLRAAAGHKWLAWASKPGIWIQSITTKEPDNSMVEVAVVSLVAALSDDEVAAVKARGPITGAALTAQYDVEADSDG
jgi:uncharacterized protein YqhQ